MLFILGFDATGLIYLYRNKRSDSLHKIIISTPGKGRAKLHV